jgi:hypothetical protein
MQPPLPPELLLHRLTCPFRARPSFSMRAPVQTATDQSPHLRQRENQDQRITIGPRPGFQPLHRHHHQYPNLRQQYHRLPTLTVVKAGTQEETVQAHQAYLSLLVHLSTQLAYTKVIMICTAHKVNHTPQRAARARDCHIDQAPSPLRRCRQTLHLAPGQRQLGMLY